MTKLARSLFPSPPTTYREFGPPAERHSRETHARRVHKCLNELLSIRAEKRKVEIGFELQKRKQEEHDRKQEEHQMKKDRHKWAVALAEAKVYNQQTLTDSVKTLQDIAKWKANSQKA